MNRDFAQTAALLADPGRASILLALLGGIALPAGQLAMIANVAPQTASSHLSKLVAGRLLMVEQQGRHRYYRIADAEVAQAVEALLAITPRSSRASPLRAREPKALVGSLAFARSCYSHLAGSVAVKIADALQQRGLLVARPGQPYLVTQRGRQWFEKLDIAISETQMRQPRFARPCLDWTERRHHVAGELGNLMFTQFRKLKWIAPVRGSRAVRVTLEGEQHLGKLLGVRLPMASDSWEA